MRAVVFPGQGSQSPGMGQAFTSEVAQETFEQISEAVGRDVADLCFNADAETLRQTNNAQIALFTVSMVAFRELEPDPAPDALAGHSVGEYAALVAGGWLSLADGARLVQRRGEVMASAGQDRPGGMAAVLGMERGPLENLCGEIDSDLGVVVIANDNCPGQLVVSGDRDAVHALSAIATEHGAKRVLPLNVSGAFHSPLMEGPAQEFKAALAEAEWREGQVPVVSNVTAHPETNWTELLEAQLKSPVRWHESMQYMLEQGLNLMVECGSGEVLCGLMRRINRDVPTHAVNDTPTAETVSETWRNA